MPGVGDQISCSAPEELWGNPEVEHTPPTLPSRPFEVCFSWEFRGAQRRGAISEDPERQSGEGAGGFSCICSGLGLQFALKTKQNNLQKYLSFHFCSPFSKLTGA